MRYVAKSLNDRMLHLADEPHTRSYCRRLRGALVVVDAKYAGERIADRTVTVCTACRTVLEDRQAAQHAMEDSFMITETAAPVRRRAAVEPTLFDLGEATEAEALPVVDVEAVIAAGVPVIGTPAGADAPVAVFTASQNHADRPGHAPADLLS
jgi:hypothetical protein